MTKSQRRAVREWLAERIAEMECDEESIDEEEPHLMSGLVRDLGTDDRVELVCAAMATEWGLATLYVTAAHGLRRAGLRPSVCL